MTDLDLDLDPRLVDLSEQAQQDEHGGMLFLLLGYALMQLATAVDTAAYYANPYYMAGAAGGG